MEDIRPAGTALGTNRDLIITRQTADRTYRRRLEVLVLQRIGYFR